jgi:hypothetical protein
MTNISDLIDFVIIITVIYAQVSQPVKRPSKERRQNAEQ